MRSIKKLTAVFLLISLLFSALPVMVSGEYDHSDHTDLALEAVSEGIVLLKNKNNALPLKQDETVALFGSGQIYTASTTSGYQIGGGGSGWVSSMQGSPLDPANAFLEAEKAGKIKVYRQLVKNYQNNINYIPSDAIYKSAANFADTAIMFIIRYSTEAADIPVSDWELSLAEETMLKKLNQHFEKVIVVLNTPSVISTDWSLDGNSYGIEVDAFLTCYMGGEKGGEGVAKVILGEVNPSGKLPHTYAKDIYDYPTTATFLENANYVNYEEDIYVGYRYFETFAKEKVAYPFGYGLSYTDFSIKTDSVKVTDSTVTLSVTVKNIGQTAGKEVVQVYYSAPQAGVGSAKISKSAVSLGAYAKTKLLAPNESQTLTLSYDISDMASFDDTGVTGHKDQYVLEAGDYTVYVGNSVRNITKVHTFNISKLKEVSAKLTEIETTLPKRLTFTGEYEILTESAEAVYNVSSDSFTLIEAENGSFSAGSPFKVEKYDQKAYLFNGTNWITMGAGSALAYLQSANGHYVQYKLNVAKAGTYRVGFIIANGTSSTDSNGKPLESGEVFGLSVSTDGSIGTKQNVSLGIENTSSVGTGYQWYNFKYKTESKNGTPFTVDLPAGEVTLTLTVGHTDASPNIDSFVLIPEGVSGDVADVAKRFESDKTNLNIDLSADNFKGITYEDVKSGAATWEELIAQMSYSELIGLCHGHTSGLVDGTGTIGFASNKTAEKYGIISADTADGPAGMRLAASASVATFWPCETLQAATWNAELLEKIGVAVAEECLRYGADIWLAPGLNIHRNPLCGRNFEYYSEDPLLTGLCASAVIKGVESRGVATTVKHFAVNNKETNRTYSDSRVSARALREIFLKGFEIAIENAAPDCVMVSYNLINGIYGSDQTALIKGVLRGEWGFDGIVMSDWYTVPANVNEFLSGTNVKMPYEDNQTAQLSAAVQSGKITREMLEENAAYVLKTIAKLPDNTTRIYKVNKIEAYGKTVLTADMFSKRAYMSRFELVGDTLSATHMDLQDEVDGSRGFIEFNIEVAAAGTYTLYLDYAAKSNVAGAFEIIINGKIVPVVKNNIQSTGDWSSYSEVEICDVELEEGLSTICIRHTGATGANYHSLTFESHLEPPPETENVVADETTDLAAPDSNAPDPAVMIIIGVAAAVAVGIAVVILVSRKKKRG